jgi:acetyltransferase-like isoleucine patch superfamily enzyme
VEVSTDTVVCDLFFSLRPSPSGEQIGAGRRELDKCSAVMNFQPTSFNGALQAGAVIAPPAAPVLIEDHVWIGAHVIILPGVRIGRHSAIGAGSVVTKDVPANCLAVGNPARVLRQTIATGSPP